MRILHVIDSREMRGGQIFASDLIRALSSADVTQLVAILSDSGGDGVRYGAPERMLGSNGWKVPGLRIRPSALRGLRELVDEWRPDIIQGHGGDSLKYTLPATMGLRTTVVYRMIGPTPPETIGFVRRAGHSLLMRRAARVVAVGEAVRRNAVGLFRVPAERVISISNAVDPSRVQAKTGREATRRALAIPPNAPVILSLGALTWEKDPLVHVEVAARVQRHRPKAIHVMVGDGPLRSQVEAAIRRHRLDGKIRMFSATADAPDIIAMSDVVLLASRTESMTAVVIEAGILRIPTAAYAVGGVPEVVVDKVTGRLARTRDVSGLAMCVLELLEDPNASKAMGEAARERYLSLFDIANIAPKYLELYQELAAS